MPTQQITVTNPTRTRKWGWDFEFQPNPAPTRPAIVGTIRHVMTERALDRTFQARNGAFIHERLFFDGRRVVEIDGMPVSYLLDTFARGWTTERAELYFGSPITLTVEVPDGE